VHVPGKRPIALLLLLCVTGCTTWSRPAGGVTPQDYVTRQRPARITVITTRGGRLTLERPVVVGDSLLETDSTAHWVDEPVAVARPPDTAIVPLAMDARGYRRIRVITASGEPLEISEPVFTADSVSGTIRSLRHGRLGVPLADVREIRRQRLNTPLTVVAVVLGVGALATTLLVAILYSQWDAN
jgi:hypothetical protein